MTSENANDLGSDSDFEPSSSKKVKVLQFAENRVCIICGKQVPSCHLTRPKDVESWLSLLSAAEIRNYQPILQYSSLTTEVPNIEYEQKCRSDFVHKKALDKLESEKDEFFDEEATDLRRTQRQPTRSLSTVYADKCIFCDKVNKYVKGSHTREKLIQCVDMRADNTIRETAAYLVTQPRSEDDRIMDDRILAATSRELVAAEAHYHKSCYKDYTRSRLLQRNTRISSEYSVFLKKNCKNVNTAKM
jgi:hypothetical protein